MVNQAERRQRRHIRLRRRIVGNPQRPRLAVFRSLQHMYAQIIDDTNGITLVSASTLDPEIKAEVKGTGNAEAALTVGKLIAKRALEKGIIQVVFDRGGNIYHGRVKALAEGARQQGLQF